MTFCKYQRIRSNKKVSENSCRIYFCKTNFEKKGRNYFFIQSYTNQYRITQYDFIEIQSEMGGIQKSVSTHFLYGVFIAVTYLSCHLVLLPVLFGRVYIGNKSWKNWSSIDMYMVHLRTNGTSIMTDSSLNDIIS